MLCVSNGLGLIARREKNPAWETFVQKMLLDGVNPKCCLMPEKLTGEPGCHCAVPQLGVSLCLPKESLPLVKRTGLREGLQRPSRPGATPTSRPIRRSYNNVAPLPPARFTLCGFALAAILGYTQPSGAERVSPWLLGSAGESRAGG